MREKVAHTSPAWGCWRNTNWRYTASCSAATIEHLNAQEQHDAELCGWRSTPRFGRTEQWPRS